MLVEVLVCWYPARTATNNQVIRRLALISLCIGLLTTTSSDVDLVLTSCCTVYSEMFRPWITSMAGIVIVPVRTKEADNDVVSCTRRRADQDAVD